MALQFDATTRESWCTTLNTNIGASATINIYSGSAPATCATSASGTLLGTFTGNASAFGTVAGEVITLETIATTTAVAGSPTNAGYFRILDSGSVCHVQGTITATGGGGDLTMTSIAITSGDTLTLTASGTLTAPGA